MAAAAALIAGPPGLESPCGFSASPLDLQGPPGTFLPATHDKGEVTTDILSLLTKDLDKRIQRPSEEPDAPHTFDAPLFVCPGTSESNGYSLFSGDGLKSTRAFGLEFPYLDEFAQTPEEKATELDVGGWSCSFPPSSYTSLYRAQAPGSPLSMTWTGLKDQPLAIDDDCWTHSFEDDFQEDASHVNADIWGSASVIPYTPAGKTHSQISPLSTPCTTASDPDAFGAEVESFCLSGTPSKWHKSAKLVGMISEDGHVFTKVAGADKIRTSAFGNHQKLSSICMIYDQRLRYGGMHRYNYQILSGEIGAADGAGFVFDTQVRRSNLQRMCSIFLNNRGQICFRNQQYVEKLSSTLPRMEVGMWLHLTADLDNLYFHFMLCDYEGNVLGAADVALGPILANMNSVAKSWQSGFFCAIVTKDISVFLE